MTKTSADKRIDWIEYAKGFAIILVVYRHVFEGLKSTPALNLSGANLESHLYLEQANIFFFSFRMPLFFIISGLLLSASLGKRGLSSFVKNKANTILYPYLLWGVIQIGIQILFSTYTNSKKSVADFGYLFYAPREVEQFWYLLALFNVTVLYAILKVRLGLGHMQQLLLGAGLFFLSSFISNAKIELGFISDIFHYYLFIAIGESISNSVRSGAHHRFFAAPRSILILLVPFIISQLYFLQTNLTHKDISPKYLYVEYQQPLAYCIIALTGSCFVIAVASFLAQHRHLKWLQYLGKHSLHIYVMHVIVFAGTRIILTRFFHVYHIETLVIACITAGVFIPAIVATAANKAGLGKLFTLEPPPKAKKQAVIHRTNPQPVYERIIEQ